MERAIMMAVGPNVFIKTVRKNFQFLSAHSEHYTKSPWAPHPFYFISEQACYLPEINIVL
jgi:hypothetical protein